MGSTETGLALTLTSRQASDFELLANEGFAPLRGFMGSDDWRSVCESMRLVAGDYWSIPITLATDLECGPGDVVGDLDPPLLPSPLEVDAQLQGRQVLGADRAQGQECDD